MEQEKEKEKLFDRRGKNMREKIESAVLRPLKNFEEDFKRKSNYARNRTCVVWFLMNDNDKYLL